MAASEQQVSSLEQQLAASILMHRHRLLQQHHTHLAPDALLPQHVTQQQQQQQDTSGAEEEELVGEEEEEDDARRAVGELISEEEEMMEESEEREEEEEEEEVEEQEQALNLSINHSASINTRKPTPLATTTQSAHIQAASISHLGQQHQLNDQTTAAAQLRRLETHLAQTATRHLLHHSNATTTTKNNNSTHPISQLNSVQTAGAASLTSHLSGVANTHVNPFGQLAASLVSSTSSAGSSSGSSSASSSSGWSSAADSLASCSPDRVPATRSPANHLQLHQSHHNHSHQQSPTSYQQQQLHLHHQQLASVNAQRNHQQFQQQHHKPLFLHHLHQHHHELGPVHKTDSDDLDRIRNFIEQFKARRGALGLTQKQAAQCFRAYTNDRYAFSDNFVGHFEGFQFRPQTAMTIADSLAEWLEYAENETRQGRQLNFMPGRVKETRKRKYEVIRIRDSAKRVLVEAFEKNKSPSTSELEQLSRRTNIPSRNIEIFFKNRRTSRQYHQ